MGFVSIVKILGTVVAEDASLWQRRPEWYPAGVSETGLDRFLRSALSWREERRIDRVGIGQG